MDRLAFDLERDSRTVLFVWMGVMNVGHVSLLERGSRLKRFMTAAS